MSLERPIPPADDQPGARLADVTLSVTDLRGGPLYGTQITYEHPALSRLLGRGRETVVLTPANPVARFRVVQEAGQGLSGTLQVQCLEARLYTGAAGPLFTYGTNGWEGLVESAITLPSWSAADPSAITLTPTALPLPQGMILQWEDAGDYLYRVYASYGADRVVTSHIGATFNTYYVLEDLVEGEQVHVLVRAEAQDGTLSSATDTTTFSVTALSPELAFIRREMPPQIQVGSGQYTTVDLGRFAFPVQRTPSEPSTIAGRWAATTITVQTFGTSVTVTRLGTQLTLSDANDGDGPTVVLVGLAQPNSPMTYLALVATVGATTEELPAYSVGLFHTRSAQRLALDFERIVGTVPTAVTIEGGGPWRGLGFDGTTLQASGREDGIPELVLLTADGGLYSAIVATTHPGTPVVTESPYLPAGTITWVEATNEFMEVLQEELLWQPLYLRTARWRRVRSGASLLYDTQSWAPPVAVHFAAPLYFRDIWWNQSLYPPDARLVGNHVEYRNGLQSPTSEPTVPVVSDVRVDPGVTSANVSWALRHPITNAPVSFTVPVYFRRTSNNTPIRMEGRDVLRLTNLLSSTEYSVRIVEDVPGNGLVFNTLAPRALVTVRAVYLDEGSYRYDYTIDDSTTPGNAMVSWSDAEGGVYETASASLLSGHIWNSHAVTVVHNDGQRYTLNVDAVWSYPPRTAELRYSAVIGRALTASAAEMPRFGISRFEGTSSSTIPANIYAAGTWSAVPEGYLPPGMPGALEDYVTVWFQDPVGAELPSPVSIPVATSLGLRVSVTAQDGKSPVVYGVRVLRQL